MGDIMVTLDETASELWPRRISRGRCVTATHPQGGTGIPPAETQRAIRGQVGGMLALMTDTPGPPVAWAVVFSFLLQTFATFAVCTNGKDPGHAIGEEV